MKKIFLLSILYAISVNLHSQKITNYSFTPSAGSFTQLSGGTTQPLSGGTVDEGYFNNVPIGFTFYYMGTA